MHSFNATKFTKDHTAVTKDGGFKVIRAFISSRGRINVTLKSLKDFAGLLSYTYDMEGNPIDMYGNIYDNRSHMNLVNE